MLTPEYQKRYNDLLDEAIQIERGARAGDNRLSRLGRYKDVLTELAELGGGKILINTYVRQHA